LGSGGIIPRISTSEIDEGLWPSSRPSPWGKRSYYPLERTLSGPQSRSRRGGEEKEVPAPVGNGTKFVVQPIA